jgi:hypothetical protein
MQPLQQEFTLSPTESRMIHGQKGFRLNVVSGCLWLTRPGDSVDRFLAAGASIELYEDDVLIQCESRTQFGVSGTARYSLVSLTHTKLVQKKHALPSRWRALTKIEPLGASL